MSTTHTQFRLGDIVKPADISQPFWRGEMLRAGKGPIVRVVDRHGADAYQVRLERNGFRRVFTLRAQDIAHATP